MSGSSYKALSKAIARDDKRSIERAIAAAERIAEARELKHWRTTGYLYAIELTSGTVKVGRTISPGTRLASHERQAANHGQQVAHRWVSHRHPDILRTEKQLLAFCAGRGSRVDDKSEYFLGLRFADVRSFGELLAEHRLGVAETAARVALDAKRDAHLDKARAAVGGDLGVLYPDALAALAARTDQAHV